MKKWEVSRYLKNGEMQGNYIIHANTIADACKLENYIMSDEEKNMFDYGIRFLGEKHAGFSFYQKFDSGLPENRIQKVWIIPIN